MARRIGDIAPQTTRRRTAGRGPIHLLDDVRTRDVHLAGAKAANLAVARANGLPVLPGFVVPTSASVHEAFTAWRQLSGDGAMNVAVRSSSANEDTAEHSMAGQFTTVLDVEGWRATAAAIEVVRASAGDEPIPVLVQPMCDARVGGVLFGIDPATGRPDPVIEAVAGSPNALVSGEAAGDASLVGRRDRRRLLRLARDAARLFGGPQDIEWAIDRDGKLWLLQSRPITAHAVQAIGPRLGPGPVAETFPDALAPLEVDLWVEPLRAGVVEALRITGTRSHKAINGSPVLVSVGGRVAADLDLIEGRARGRLAALVDPRPPARRLAASWRVGRLRRAMPMLAGDVVAAVDGLLAAVPSLDDLGDAELVALIGRCRVALRSAHGYEVLSGMLAPDEGGTGIEHALLALAVGRARDASDAEIVATSPIVLALVPPRIGEPALPPSFSRPTASVASLGHREALRVRARWLQELCGRAALVLGGRWLDDPLTARWLTLDELVAVALEGADVPLALWTRLASDAPAPLPSSFRLTESGDVVAEVASGSGGGKGAGGGRGIGTVAGLDDDPAGTVLVVRTLDPRLAPSLEGRSGLVSETGSVLSHLAIVARELGVPTVVGLPGAVERFPAGTRVVVDGRTGDVEVVT